MVELVKQNFKVNKQRFKKTKILLLKNIAIDVEIEHVGSTAIPNMYGKNILDILIGVNNQTEFEEVKQSLIKINFVPSEKSKTENYQFFSSTEKETHDGDIHIHLVIKNTERYDEFIVLRDYLLINKKEAKDYSNLKKELIKNGITDRKEYKNKKAIYVSSLIERAKKSKFKA